MANAQTVMVVLDIQYRYRGHGESNGAHNNAFCESSD
jgi:hypothetical protein